MLEEDAIEQDELGINLHPSLMINKVAYRGYLDGNDVFDAICLSFKQKPAMCHGNIEEEAGPIFSSAEDIKKRMTKMEAIETAVRMKKYIVIGSLLMGLICEIGFWLWYRRKNSQAVNERMRN